MRMRGPDICRVWSRVPGLNDYWCQQIQWRISKDDELISALTEPRYPCPDDSLDTIILTQTVYLCQLFLHLQEFDPCAADTTDSSVPNDELLCVFQDSLAREFNFAHGPHPGGPGTAPDQQRRNDSGPAPVGEALERLVRGLMLAQRQEPLPPPPPPPPPPQQPPASPADAHRAQLHALLIRILRELNEPVDKHPIRYEQAYGPRRDDTWAARFATRVMQWRWSVRYAPAALVDEVIEVQRHDVHPLDDEGLEVYRILRCSAPGLIHINTPLHPDTMHPLPPAGAAATADHHHHHQQQPPFPPQATGSSSHQRGGSGRIKVQQMLGTPLAQTPASSHSEGSDTPRTTPRLSQPQPPQPASVEGGIKRSSEDLGQLPPPSKRSRPIATEAVVAGDGARDAAMARAAMAMTDELAIRDSGAQGVLMEVDAAPRPLPPPQANVSAAAVEETNALLRRTLEGIAELGRKMDGMQAVMDQRLKGLDEKLNRIFEWVGSED